MNYSSLLESIKQTFINQDKYFFDKHVPEFEKDGAFLGDYFNQIAVEPMGNKPPRFYHTFSPFDVISNKAPHYAAVFENGERILDIDFETYVAMRTAAMNMVVLNGMGLNDLRDKKVLLFGAGKVATEAVKVLAGAGLDHLDIISRSGDLTAITAATVECKISISKGDLANIGQYDIIVAHTQAAAPLLSKEQLAGIKQGAVLCSFITSTEHGEYPDEVYDAAKANIITDWKQSLVGAKDLKRALEARLFSEQDILYVKDLLTGKSIDQSKQYTVYRSAGTPIQNLAVLKLLIES